MLSIEVQYYVYIYIPVLKFWTWFLLEQVASGEILKEVQLIGHNWLRWQAWLHDSGPFAFVVIDKMVFEGRVRYSNRDENVQGHEQEPLMIFEAETSVIVLSCEAGDELFGTSF